MLKREHLMGPTAEPWQRQRTLRINVFMPAKPKAPQVRRIGKTWKEDDMTIPDEPPGFDPGFFAVRMEKWCEARVCCSCCGRFSPQTRRMVKSDAGGVCDDCVGELVAAWHAQLYQHEEGECRFCKRVSAQVHRMLCLNDVEICSDCTFACVATLREYEQLLFEEGAVDRWDMGHIDCID
jgi:hypothetical protein